MHEIDIKTFAKMSGLDLLEIGITAFGARKRLSLAIGQLNSEIRPFSGSAAPGAERRPSNGW